MKHGKRLRLGIFPLLISLTLVALIIVPRPAHGATRASTCQSFNVPVALAEGQPLQYTIYGELCNPSRGASDSIQLLVPGAFSVIGGVLINFLCGIRACLPVPGGPGKSVENFARWRQALETCSIFTLASKASEGFEKALQAGCHSDLWLFRTFRAQQ